MFVTGPAKFLSYSWFCRSSTNFCRNVDERRQKFVDVVATTKLKNNREGVTTKRQFMSTKSSSLLFTLSLVSLSHSTFTAYWQRTMASHIDVLTAAQVMERGLLFMGFSREKQNEMKHHLRLAQFKSHYGCLPIVVVCIFVDVCFFVDVFCRSTPQRLLFCRSTKICRSTKFVDARRQFWIVDGTSDKIISTMWRVVISFGGVLLYLIIQI